MKKFIFSISIILIIPLALLSQTPTESDIVYSAQENEKLDYWQAAESNSPIVILVTGKDWNNKGKDTQPWVDAAKLFHQNNYAVISVDYIISSDPAYKGFPQQPANLACAIGWAKENADLLHGDPEKLILFGASAGAHLATLHALHPFNDEKNDCSYNTDAAIAGVIALSGVYDFSLIPKESKTKKGIMRMLKDSTAYWKKAQPIEALLRKDQPGTNPETRFLLLHGTRDAFAGNNQPFAFQKSLEEQDFSVEMDIIEDREDDLIDDLADPDSWIAERVISFANSFGRKASPTAVSPAAAASQIKIYPNPTEGDLLIEFEPGFYQSAEFILTGVDGREILHTAKHYKDQVKLAIENCPPGTYILSILTDRDHHQHKVMIYQ